ncbi:MAG: GatB/YqeY domain-containing protein [Deltaproteobacteria bacterium]|nr:GatB/YqeY domain-containing protein [Deltaproteobacteria bacterium]
MSIAKQIDADYKKAFKGRRRDEVEALRLVRSALKMKEKEGPGELDDEATIKILKRLVKQRNEAAQIYSQAGRDDRAAGEKAESDLISAYLPAQVGEAAIRRVVAEVVDELGAEGPKQMGPVMKAALAKLGPGAAGKAVNSIVREILQAK